MSTKGRGDHIDRLIAQRRAVTPNVSLDGMEILGRARRLTLLSRESIEGVFERYGLDTGEFDVLATLRRLDRPSVRPTELYQELMISSGGLTDRLRRLEEAGWIARIDCDDDRRSKLVQLTDKGRNLIDKAFLEDMAIEKQLLAALNGTERSQLADLLAKLLKAIEDKFAILQP